jgi:hypothetical protein
MPKINNREIYKNIDFPSLLDFLLGTKADDGKTKSFPLQSIIQLINSVNGKNNIQYQFSDLSVPSDPEIDYLTPGYFFTNNNNTEVGTFTQLIFNKETLYPIDLTQLFNKLGTLEDVVIKLENPSDPNNFFNFKVVSFTDNTDFFTFGVQDFNELYLGEFVNEQIYSLYFDIKSASSDDFSKVVYFNALTPSTATIFDLNNPPVTNDNTLKVNDQNLYIGSDASTWVYKTSIAAYETKTITSDTSNFNFAGTNVSAGNSKTANIKRIGRVGGGNAVDADDFVTKAQSDLKENLLNKTGTISGNEASNSFYATLNGFTSWIRNNLFNWVGILDKTIPVDSDNILSGDSAASNQTKKISLLNLFNYIKSKSETEISYACSDEVSDLAVGLLITFRMPIGLTLTNVKLSLNLAPTVSKVIIDIKKNGTTIFSTLPSVDTSSTTSVGASVPAVISDSNLVDDSIITISTTQVGSGVAGKGLKVTLIGNKI